MTSTTVNRHDDYLDGWSRIAGLWPTPKDTEYEIRRLGKKDYGVFQGRYGTAMLARYKCSHLEARRRFTLLLVTRRMKS